MTKHLPVPEFQHGFRKDHSTLTALNEFNDDITNGFNKKAPPDRTVLLQLDLSKAFDMVSHEERFKWIPASIFSQKIALYISLRKTISCKFQKIKIKLIRSKDQWINHLYQKTNRIIPVVWLYKQAKYNRYFSNS